MAYDKDYFQGRSVDDDRATIAPYWVIAAVLFGIGTLLYHVNGMAEGLSRPTPVAELFKAAIKFGGFEQECMQRRGGCQMPGVTIVLIEDANVAGLFFFRDPNTVKMNAQVHTPGTLEWNATLVHEFVHYLQWLTGKLGPQTQCEQMVEIEEPAYKAGSAYLAQFGIVKDYKSQLSSIAFMSATCGMGY